MALNLARLTTVTFARVHDDAAGAGVRTNLGAAAASVIFAHQISKDTLPARPFLALKRNPTSPNGFLIRVPYIFYVYDELPQGTFRLETIATALAAAFDIEATPWRPSDVTIHSVTIGDAGHAEPDSTLGLRVLPVRVSISAS